MRRPPRIVVLIALLAGAAAWVAIDLRGPAAPTSAKAPASGASQEPEHAAAPASEAKQPGIPARSALGRIAADPFSAQSWLPRRKPAVVSSAPPEPVTAPTQGASADNPIPGRSAPAQLRWEGPASARAGASFNVSLRVTSGEQIRAAPMQLRFDPAVLESVSVRPGRYFSAEKTGSFGYRVNSDGSIFVGVSNQTPASASDAEMLVLTFKSIRAAEAAEISVASLNLQGAAGRTIAYNGLTPFRTTITP